jgi:hypothetical protein
VSLPLLNGRPLRVVIRSIGISAGSPLEARRLADALAPALERALGRVVFDAPRPTRIQGPADHVATRIADVVEARLRGGS